MSVQYAIIKSIRPFNLLIILVTMAVFGLAVEHLNSQDIDWTRLLIYSMCLVLIAAAGNLLNDIVDIESDRSNKKTRNQIDAVIPKFLAWTLYVVLNIISLFIVWTFFEKFDIGFKLLIFTIALLAIYSLFLQKLPVIGNATVALLCAVPIIFVGILTLPSDILLQIVDITDIGTNRTDLPVTLIQLYSIFAFGTTFLREMVKDIEDVSGDEQAGYTTLPVLIGFKASKLVSLVSATLWLVGISALILALWQVGGYWNSFCILFSVIVIIPIVFVVFGISKMNDPKSAAQLSFYLKAIISLGVLSAVYFWFI